MTLLDASRRFRNAFSFLGSQPGIVSTWFPSRLSDTRFTNFSRPVKQ